MFEEIANYSKGLAISFYCPELNLCLFLNRLLKLIKY